MLRSEALSAAQAESRGDAGMQGCTALGLSAEAVVAIIKAAV